MERSTPSGTGKDASAGGRTRMRRRADTAASAGPGSPSGTNCATATTSPPIGVGSGGKRPHPRDRRVHLVHRDQLHAVVRAAWTVLAAVPPARTTREVALHDDGSAPERPVALRRHRSA